MQRTTASKAIGVALQFIAIAMILSSVFLSHRGSDGIHEAAFRVCMGDHAICGCAPARVAMRNCCCFKSEAACCEQGGHEFGSEQTDGDGAIPGIFAAPCGDWPNYLDPFSAKIDLAVSSAPKIIRCGWQFLPYPSRFFDSPASRLPEPPVPPPKNSPIA